MQPLSYYLNASYLFDLRPEPLGPAGRVLLPTLSLGMAAASVISYSLAANLADPIRRAGYRRIAAPLLTMGILGVLYTATAWVGAPVLSVRLILLLWLVVSIAWVALTAWREANIQPVRRAERERRLQLEKYLPK